MRKNRILYALWLLASILLFVLASSRGATALLCCSVAVPIIYAVAVRLSASGLTASVKVDEGCAVEIKNNSLVPMTVELKLACRNMLTGRKAERAVTASLTPRGNKRIEFSLASDYCGRLELFVENMRAYEPLGVYGFKAGGKCEGAFSVVQPKQFACEVAFSEGQSDSYDGNDYSMEKSGNDSSETFLIREYVPGDSIKSIHWKLSGKTDKIMVREQGLPVSNETLLLLDMAYQTEPPSSGAINTLAECFVSIGIALLEKHICFIASFMKSGGEMEYFSINSPEELSLAVDEMLSNTFFKSEAPTELCFKNDIQAQRFEHIVYLTANSKAHLEALCNGSRVNAIVLARDKANAGGAYVTRISNKTYKQALALVEV